MRTFPKANVRLLDCPKPLLHAAAGEKYPVGTEKYLIKTEKYPVRTEKNSLSEKSRLFYNKLIKTTRENKK